MKEPYYDFVNHMLRDYFLHEDEMAGKVSIEQAQPVSTMNEATEKNRAACEQVLRRTRPRDVDILREVYSGSKESELATAVRFCAEKRSMSQLDVWKVVRSISRDVARERGLI